MCYAYIVVFTPLHQMCALSRLRADGLSIVNGQVDGLACVYVCRPPFRRAGGRHRCRIQLVLAFNRGARIVRTTTYKFVAGHGESTRFRDIKSIIIMCEKRRCNYLWLFFLSSCYVMYIIYNNVVGPTFTRGALRTYRPCKTFI